MTLAIINAFTFEVVLSIFVVSCLGARRGGTERKEIGTEHCRKRSNPARVFKIGFMFCVLCLTCAQPGDALAQFSILHSFGSSTEDGKAPLGSLTQSGSTLYGMTCSGGAHNLGAVFRIHMDDSGYQLLHSFGGVPSDGASACGGPLTLAGSTLYGTTAGGGSENFGTIFRIGTDGSGYEILHSF